MAWWLAGLPLLLLTLAVLAAGIFGRVADEAGLVFVRPKDGDERGDILDKEGHKQGYGIRRPEGVWDLFRLDGSRLGEGARFKQRATRPCACPPVGIPSQNTSSDTAAEGRPESAIQCLRLHLSQVVRPIPTPSHLLFLGHAFAHGPMIADSAKAGDLEAFLGEAVSNFGSAINAALVLIGDKLDVY